MDAKDLILAVGVLVTLVLGFWNMWANLYTNKRTTFINTVTSQRIKWIEQLRQDIGAFCGLTYHWSHTDLEGKPSEGDLLKEVDRLRHVIRLRLNPKGEHDRAIEALIEEIPRYTDPSRQKELTAALERLVRVSQALLKEEWDRVKRESEEGPLSDRA